MLAESSTQRQLHVIIVSLLSLGVASQLPVTFLANTSLKWPILLNTLAHLSILLVILYRLKTQRYRFASYLIMGVFISYLWFSTLLWQHNYQTHWFMLLGIFIACYLFDHRQTVSLVIFISLCALSFLCLEVLFVNGFSLLPKPLYYLPYISINNAVVLLIACLALAYSIRHILLSDWTSMAAKVSRASQILEQILPSRLLPSSNTNVPVTQYVPNMSVMFVDMSGYSEFAAQHSMEKKLMLLHSVYCAFDDVLVKHQVVRIKTNGDQYIAAVGVSMNLTLSSQECALKLSAAACQLPSVFAKIAAQYGFQSSLRIGLASGDATIGVIGKLRPQFDLWGPTIIEAAYLEQSCPLEQIQVCTTTADLIASRFSVSKRGKLHLKGLGERDIYLLHAPLSDEIYEQH